MKRLFIESTIFKKLIDELNEPLVLRQIQLEIIRLPEIGDVIEGTGGVRKMRLPQKGKGKSGGYRVLYLDLPNLHVCHLLLIYSKSEKENISADEKKVIKQTVERIKKGG